MWVEELNRANIAVEGNTAVVTGVEQQMKPVISDLRASAALLLREWSHRGNNRSWYLSYDRGYSIEEKLRQVGAKCAEFLKATRKIPVYDTDYHCPNQGAS